MATRQEKTFDWDVNQPESARDETDRQIGDQRITGEVLPRRSLASADRRTDNKRRTVFFEPDRIVMLRNVAGVSMRIVVPVARFSDVRLKVKFAPAAPAYQVILRHDDPDLSITLFENDDLDFARAALSEWANYFDMDRQEDVTGPANGTAHVDQTNSKCREPIAGAVVEREPIARRRGAILSRRRPRLFSRRHTGDRALMKKIYRGSREIIARN